MTRNARVSLALVAVLVVGVVIALLVGGGEDPASERAAAATPTAAPGGNQLVRENSHRLDTAEGDAPVLVEFLDFECEGCGALFPLMEELRDKHRGELNFVIRYFPNKGHFNGQLSAQAAEAAARQGKLEPMYQRLFETQAEWGEAQTSKEQVFLDIAEDLGLDMERFKADLHSPEVEARVKQDLDEGLALGVEGTPSLFLDGKPLELTTVEQLEADLEAAVERQ